MNIFKAIQKKILALKNHTDTNVKDMSTPLPAPDSNEITGSMQKTLLNLKENGLKCQQIIDVGAHMGSWSVLARKIFTEAAFHLIEPQKEMQEHLERFCKNYPSSSYSLAGAGKKKESLTLTIWDNLTGSSFLPKPNEELQQSGKQRTIEIITIDDLIAEKIISTPELIKLDVQGFELEALKGAESTFGITEVYILEVSLFPFEGVPGTPVFSDVINFMLERDYAVYDFAGFLRRPLDNALGQCDICFVKKDSFLRASNKWQ